MFRLFNEKDFESKGRKIESKKIKNYDICEKYKLKMEYIVAI